MDGLDAIVERLERRLEYERTALAKDDPESRCAAHHRGRIDGLSDALGLLAAHRQRADAAANAPSVGAGEEK
jgi:hypothetical protein